MTVLILKSATDHAEIRELEAQFPDLVMITQSKAFTGAEAEFVAICTVTGVIAKSLFDFLTAVVKRNEAIEISIKDVTVKGISVLDAKRLLESFTNTDKKNDRR